MEECCERKAEPCGSRKLKFRAHHPGRGSTLLEVDLYGRFNLLPVAITHRQADQNVNVNPPDRTVLPPGAVLLVRGSMQDVHRARREAAPS